MDGEWSTVDVAVVGIQGQNGLCQNSGKVRCSGRTTPAWRHLRWTFVIKKRLKIGMRGTVFASKCSSNELWSQPWGDQLRCVELPWMDQETKQRYFELFSLTMVIKIFKTDLNFWICVFQNQFFSQTKLELVGKGYWMKCSSSQRIWTHGLTQPSHKS